MLSFGIYKITFKLALWREKFKMSNELDVSAFSSNSLAAACTWIYYDVRKLRYKVSSLNFDLNIPLASVIPARQWSRNHQQRLQQAFYGMFNFWDIFAAIEWHWIQLSHAYVLFVIPMMQGRNIIIFQIVKITS